MSAELEQTNTELEQLDTPTPEVEETTPETTEEPTPDLEEVLAEYGGIEGVKEKAAIYDSYASPNFNPQEFISKLVETSDTRFNQTVEYLFKHPELRNYALSVNGVNPQDYTAYQQWKSAGMPSSVKEDGISDEDLANSDDPKDRELLRLRQEQRAAKQRDMQAQARQQENDEKERLVQIRRDAADFDNDRRSVIANGLTKLNIGTDPLAVKAKEAIEAYTQHLFFKNAQASNQYHSSLDLIKDGQTKLAKNLGPSMDLITNKKFAEASTFILDLLQAKRELETMKRGNVARRIEAPANGVSSPASSGAPTNTNNVAAFDKAAGLAKLRELKAQKGGSLV